MKSQRLYSLLNFLEKYYPLIDWSEMSDADIFTLGSNIMKDISELRELQTSGKKPLNHLREAIKEMPSTVSAKNPDVVALMKTVSHILNYLDNRD